MLGTPHKIYWKCLRKFQERSPSLSASTDHSGKVRRPRASEDQRQTRMACWLFRRRWYCRSSLWRRRPIDSSLLDSQRFFSGNFAHATNHWRSLQSSTGIRDETPTSSRWPRRQEGIFVQANFSAADRLRRRRTTCFSRVSSSTTRRRRWPSAEICTPLRRNRRGGRRPDAQRHVLLQRTQASSRNVRRNSDV